MSNLNPTPEEALKSLEQACNVEFYIGKKKLAVLRAAIKDTNYKAPEDPKPVEVDKKSGEALSAIKEREAKAAKADKKPAAKPAAKPAETKA